jgi:hypothetical protein
MENALEQLRTISAEDYAKVKGMVNVVRHRVDQRSGTGWRNRHTLRQLEDGTTAETINKVCPFHSRNSGAGQRHNGG